MLTILAVVLIFVGLGVLLALALGLGMEHDDATAERQRQVAQEARDADWRLQQLTRAAFEQMLDEARRQR